MKLVKSSTIFLKLLLKLLTTIIKLHTVMVKLPTRTTVVKLSTCYF
jgi:hypothetical protein